MQHSSRRWKCKLKFFHGAYVEDLEGILEGTGKAIGHVKVWNTDKMSSEAI